MYKAFRFRLYPSQEQAKRMESWIHTLRFLWNLANEQRLIGLSRARSERKYYSMFDQSKELTDVRAEFGWVADVPRNACVQVLDNLDVAWRNCFNRTAGQPRWKRKFDDSVGICEFDSRSWKLSGGLLRFPKVGDIPIVQHRQVVGKPRSCTIKKDVDQWFVSLVYQIEVPEPPRRTVPCVAIDRGVVNIAADSDGNIHENPRHLTKALSRLAYLQRIVARRKKGSSNQKKAKLRVARLCRKIRRQRCHTIHELTTAYSKSHGTVVIEKLDVSSMTASASGSVESPGKNVSSKRSLNRAIIDSGWGMFVECLRYKLLWSGGVLVEVGAAYSSQTCSACGSVDSESRRSQSVFRCTTCGHSENADVNAAKVLKVRANRSVMPAEEALVASDEAGNRLPRGKEDQKMHHRTHEELP